MGGGEGRRDESGKEIEMDCRMSRERRECRTEKRGEQKGEKVK